MSEKGNGTVVTLGDVESFARGRSHVGCVGMYISAILRSDIDTAEGLESDPLLCFALFLSAEWGTNHFLERMAGFRWRYLSLTGG